MSVLESEILKLPTPEKMALAEKLWETIDMETSHFLMKEQANLIKERLEEHNNNPGTGGSWEEIKRQYKTD
ncbi:MAG: addiction module protein [Chitinophagaceae bacterium]